MKQKPLPTKPRQRYSARQIAEALEIIARSGRDFNIAADRTGIKSATLKAWWYKKNSATKDRPECSDRSGIVPRISADAIHDADSQDPSPGPFNETRQENLQAISRTLDRCISRIYEILPQCQNIHLIAEATRAVAEAYKTVVNASPKDAETETAKVTNNFTSIIAQINAAQKDQASK